MRDGYEFCSAVRNGHIEVTINRPESHNALHPYAHDELGEIFDVFEDDDDLWVAIITGAGDKVFCTCNDLKYSASGKPMWIPKSGFGGLMSRQRRKPLIAAVNGFAMGGGMEIALVSDIVIAAGEALQAARKYAEAICKNSHSAVQLSKKLLNETAEHASIDPVVRDMPNAINDLLSSEDFMGGLHAVAEKRKPRWTEK